MKQQKLLLIVVILITFVSIAGLGSAQSPEPITLRYPETPGTINFIRVATELGFAAEEGITFEATGSVSGGPAAIQALAGGSIDIGTSTNAIPLITARKAGIKIKFIAVGNTTDKYDENGQPVIGPGLIVHDDSSITKPEDLVGKRIGVNTLGAQAEYTVKKWLRTADIPFEQVELVVVPTGNYIQVFSQGQVDALYSDYTTASVLAENGQKVTLISEATLLGGDFGTWGVFVSEDLINNQPEVVQRFLRVYVKAWDWSREHLLEYRALAKKLAEDEGGNPALAQYYLANGRPHALLVEDDVQFWINELVINGKITEGEVLPADLYTNEFNPYFGVAAEATAEATSGVTPEATAEATPGQ